MWKNDFEFLFKIILFIFSLLNISCYIKLDIEKFSIDIQPHNNSNIINIIKNKLRHSMKTTIEIGTPPQKVDLFLLMNESLFIFIENNNNKYGQYNNIINSYISFNSNSFVSCSNSTFSNNTQSIMASAKDVISFDFYTFFNKKEKKICLLKKEFEFYINNSNNTNNISSNLIAVLGLGPNYIEEDNKNIHKIPSFISQLKKYGLISSYRWFINLVKDKNEIIFGLSPHEYDKNNFNENQLVSIPARPFKNRITHKMTFNWNFHISKMYLESEINTNITILDLTPEMSIDLDYNSEFIISIQKYWAYCTQNIFNEFINDKKCFINILDNINNNTQHDKPKYLSIYCDNKYKDEIKKNFKDIKIECQECNYTFVLTFDDLMKSIKIINKDGKEETKLLFLVVFNDNTFSIPHYHRWVMGIPFLKKYQFFFEQNSKMIYFYKKENTIISNNENNNNKKNIPLFNNDSYYQIIIIIILILFNLFIFFLIYKTVKMMKYKQKEKINKNKFEKDDYKELIEK